MDSWHSYPKVWNFGHAAVKELLLDPVILEEKIDGSQFSFGKFGDVLKLRSKGKEIDPEYPEKMFLKGIESVKERVHLLQDGWTYRAEYLASPGHNIHTYDRVPKNHLMIFDVNTGEEQYLTYPEKLQEALRLEFECVPLLYSGMLQDFRIFEALLQKESVLGKEKIEGVVVKNYARFGRDKKVLMAKHVSEAFKEEHKSSWKQINPGKAEIIESMGLKYTSQVRWQKAVQHLREQGLITDSPKDIGALIQEVKKDAKVECMDDIMKDLFEWSWPQLERKIIRGFPEWYKNELLKKQFEVSDDRQDASA